MKQLNVEVTLSSGDSARVGEVTLYFSNDTPDSDLNLDVMIQKVMRKVKELSQA